MGIVEKLRNRGQIMVLEVAAGAFEELCKGEDDLFPYRLQTKRVTVLLGYVLFEYKDRLKNRDRAQRNLIKVYEGIIEK